MRRMKEIEQEVQLITDEEFIGKGDKKERNERVNQMKIDFFDKGLLDEMFNFIQKQNEQTHKSNISLSKLEKANLNQACKKLKKSGFNELNGKENKEYINSLVNVIEALIKNENDWNYQNVE